MGEVRLIDANNLKFILKTGVEQGIIKSLRDVEDFIDEMTVYDEEMLYPRWENPDTNPPKPEMEVLILYCYGTGYGITTAFYEDGTILQHESAFYFEDIEEWGTYDEENDEYRIPKGWWENRHYCPDDVPDYQVNDTVVGWMPLPNKPKEVA